MLGFGDCFILCSIELPRPRSPTCVSSLLASTLPISPQLKLLHLRRLASSCDAQVESETIQSHYTLSLSLLYPLSFSLFSLSSLSFTLPFSLLIPAATIRCNKSIVCHPVRASHTGEEGGGSFAVHQCEAEIIFERAPHPSSSATAHPSAEQLGRMHRARIGRNSPPPITGFW